jgi:transposase-like protein
MGKRTRWNEETAARVLAEVERSGLSEEVFCERRGLEPQRLKRWRARLGIATRRGASPAATAQFVEVLAREGTIACSTATAMEVEVVLANGRRLRAPAMIAPGQLGALATALEMPC